MYTIFGNLNLKNIKEERKRLYEKLEESIKKGATNFLVGHFDNFQALAMGVLVELKSKYPINITLACATLESYEVASVVAPALFGNIKIIYFDNDSADKIHNCIKSMIDKSKLIFFDVDENKCKGDILYALNYAKLNNKSYEIISNKIV